MVVKILLEPILEPIFDEDSYGYRPRRSAHQAIAIIRQRCWKYDWVVEFDVKGLFDNIPHSLLMKALKKHCKEPWILLYVQRWLIIKVYFMTKKTGQHVVKNPSGGWAVKKGGSSKATKIYTTKDDAVEHGRTIAQNQKTELYIHGKDGKIQNKNSYGNDPCPPKDKK